MKRTFANRFIDVIAGALGIEKIIELKWYDEKMLFALIAHELGHIWHMETGGVFHQQITMREKSVFQLFSEGIAMYFEQKLCENDWFYHQDKVGWLSWCKTHKSEIKQEYFLGYKTKSVYKISLEIGAVIRDIQMLDIIWGVNLLNILSPN